MTDDGWRRRYETKGIMRGAYLMRCPTAPDVVRCPTWLRQKAWVAAYPHEDGTWYEGPKREVKERAEEDLKAYAEMIEWLRERRLSSVGVRT